MKAGNQARGSGGKGSGNGPWTKSIEFCKQAISGIAEMRQQLIMRFASKTAAGLVPALVRPRRAGAEVAAAHRWPGRKP